MTTRVKSIEPAANGTQVPDKGQHLLIEPIRPKILDITIEGLSDADLRQRFLVEARTFIESMERRYAHLLDVSGILDNLRRATA